MSAEKNIEKLKINLPEAKAPVGNYVATKISGKTLFISGQNSSSIKGQKITKVAISTIEKIIKELKLL